MNHSNETDCGTACDVPQDMWLRKNHMRLNKFVDLNMWASRLCAYVAGKPVVDMPGQDKRKTVLSPAYVIVLKTLVKMFDVDENMEYKVRKERLDNAGFRDACWEEVQTRWSNHRTYGKVSRSQICAVFKTFQAAGIIERDTRYDRDTGKRRMKIRLRSDRVIALIGETEDAIKAGKAARAIARLDQKTTRKNANHDNLSESGTRPIDRTSFLKGYIQQSVTSSTVTPSSTLAVDGKKEKDAGVAGQPFFSVFEPAVPSTNIPAPGADRPLPDKSGDKLREITEFIQDYYNQPELTKAQTRLIRRYFSTQLPVLKMTFERLDRITSAPGNRYNDVNGLLFNWPRLVQEYLLEQEVRTISKYAGMQKSIENIAETHEFYVTSNLRYIDAKSGVALSLPKTAHGMSGLFDALCRRKEL